MHMHLAGRGRCAHQEKDADGRGQECSCYCVGVFLIARMSSFDNDPLACSQVDRLEGCGEHAELVLAQHENVWEVREHSACTSVCQHRCSDLWRREDAKLVNERVCVAQPQQLCQETVSVW